MFLLWENTILPPVQIEDLKYFEFCIPNTKNPNYSINFYLSNSETPIVWVFSNESAAKLAYKNVVQTLINLGLAINCAKPDEINKTTKHTIIRRTDI